MAAQQCGYTWFISINQCNLDQGAEIFESRSHKYLFLKIKIKQHLSSFCNYVVSCNQLTFNTSKKKPSSHSNMEQLFHVVMKSGFNTCGFCFFIQEKENTPFFFYLSASLSWDKILKCCFQLTISTYSIAQAVF